VKVVRRFPTAARSGPAHSLTYEDARQGPFLARRLAANGGPSSRTLTWKIMLAFAVLRRTGGHRHPGPLRVPPPLLETHGIARGHDANAVLELNENGTEATRAGDHAAGGALPLRKLGPPVPDVVIVLGHRA
jgi:hypothetical protein